MHMCSAKRKSPDNFIRSTELCLAVVPIHSKKLSWCICNPFGFTPFICSEWDSNQCFWHGRWANKDAKDLASVASVPLEIRGVRFTHTALTSWPP